MPRPQTISDEEILDTARAVFLELGAQTSTAVVAKRLGISQAVLFQRFGTKEQLLIEALKPREEPAFIGHLRQGPDDRPLPEQLLALAREFSSFLRELTPCVAVMRSAGIDFAQVWKGKPEEAPPLRTQRLMADWLRKSQDAGQLSEEVDPESAATVFLGSLQIRPFIAHVVGSELPVPEHDPYLEQLVSILWQGMSPREEP